jgi:hypothetical protein
MNMSSSHPEYRFYVCVVHVVLHVAHFVVSCKKGILALIAAHLKKKKKNCKLRGKKCITGFVIVFDVASSMMEES